MPKRSKSSRKRDISIEGFVHLNKYIPHTPFPKQLAFLMLDCLEAMYGGAAGPGKSDALLMAALQYVDVPGYSAILFRRTYQDLSLPGALMDRAQEWLRGTDAVWHPSEHKWTFPSGAVLQFAYLDNASDRFRYQSSHFQFIGWDELTQFEERCYLYLYSRLRRLQGSEIPLRCRSASNPGGIGHEWVKMRFLTSKAKDRIFIPAKLQDNPHIDQESYIQSLSNLDPITRQQLLNGDWTVKEAGHIFDRVWCQDTMYTQTPPKCKWVRYWDFAATRKKKGSEPDFTCGVLMGRDERGDVWIEDVIRKRDTPGGTDSLVKMTAALDSASHHDIDIVKEQEPGASGVRDIDHVRQVLAGFRFHADKKTVDKVMRAGPLASFAEGGHVHVKQAQWTTLFLDEFEAFPNGEHDDQVDAASGAFAVLTGTVGKGMLEWAKKRAEEIRAKIASGELDEND